MGILSKKVLTLNQVDCLNSCYTNYLALQVSCHYRSRIVSVTRNPQRLKNHEALGKYSWDNQLQTTVPADLVSCPDHTSHE